jgi:hypothetical protein
MRTSTKDSLLEVLLDAKLREKYRKALLRLADLVGDLSSEGERAFRDQERLCRFLHDQIFGLENVQSQG